MSSRLRIESSRANGAKSRGPKTAEGKRRSSHNSLRHGMLAKITLLPGEPEENFLQLTQQHVDRFAPIDDVEFNMVEEMANSYWRLRRAWYLEKIMLQKAMAQQPPGDDDDILIGAFRQLADSHDIALLNRYESRLHLQYSRALRNLERVRTMPQPQEPDEPNEPTEPQEAQQSPETEVTPDLPAACAENSGIPNEPNHPQARGPASSPICDTESVAASQVSPSPRLPVSPSPSPRQIAASQVPPSQATQPPSHKRHNPGTKDTHREYKLDC